MPATAVPPTDPEASLSARAAWLYFSGGMTQAQIAKRLGVPSTKAHRLVARATRDGLVRVVVDASVAECVTLEEALTDEFALSYCRVSPDLDESPLPLRSLGAAGAAFLGDALERGAHDIIGFGHGRTLAAAVNAIPAVAPAKGSVVSLLGGLTRRFAANPFDVIHRLAEKTSAQAYMLPAPLFANSAADRAVLMAQMGIAEVLEMGRNASLLVVGVGELGEKAHLHQTGMLTGPEQAELRKRGARGELLGHYFNASGKHLDVSLEARVISPTVDELRDRNIVAISGGAAKIAALQAVLGSGLLKGLITDEATARGLVMNGSGKRPAKPGK